MGKRTEDAMELETTRTFTHDGVTIIQVYIGDGEYIYEIPDIESAFSTLQEARAAARRVGPEYWNR